MGSEMHVADNDSGVLESINVGNDGAFVELRSLIPDNQSHENHGEPTLCCRRRNLWLTMSFMFSALTLWVTISFVFSTLTFSQIYGTSAENPSLKLFPFTSSIPFRDPSNRARVQIENYRRATGLMLYVHITHHGGTSFCHSVGHANDTVGGTPPFACLGLKDFNVSEDYPKPEETPWKHNETAKHIATVRKYFHMISWEYSYLNPPSTPIAETNFEDPNLLSVIVMRHPISRLLAGDGWVAKTYPGIRNGNATHEEWWEYAQTTHGNTNNFALRVLAGRECCDGEKTDPKHLQAAKNLIGRFSIVLDIECLDEGMKALTDLLNITMQKTGRERQKKVHSSPQERIRYDDVYEYLLRRNKLDIELYEWSKGLALVNCSALNASV